MGMCVLAAVFTGLAILVFIISRQPDEFRVVRSIIINASAADIFPYVNDLRQWEPWSPWAKLDPVAKVEFSGPSAGEGSMMRWDGNNKVGAGSSTITKSQPFDLIRFQLNFLRPMKATNTAEFTFITEGAQTVVNWEMHGKNKFMSKAISLFIDCEKIVGAEFEKGLADLKNIVERTR